MSETLAENKAPVVERMRQPVVLRVRCGQCMFFKRHKTYAQPCSQLGVRTYSRPCTRFVASSYEVDSDSEQHKTILQLLEKTDNNDLARITALLNQEIQTRREGFRHNQTVYILAFGEDYLSNYRRAAVMSVVGDWIYLKGEDKDGRFHGSYLRQSILTEEEFKRKRTSLIRRKRTRDPNWAQYSTHRPELPVGAKLLDYQPPTFDDYIKLENKSKNNNAKNGKSKRFESGKAVAVRVRG